MAPVTLSYLNFPFPSPTNPSLLFIVFSVDSYRIFFLSYPVFFFNTYSPASKLSLIPICCCTGPYSTPELPPPGRMKIWASSLPSVYEHLVAQHQQVLKQIFTFSQLPPSASYYYGCSPIQVIMCLYDAHHLESLPKSSNLVIQPFYFLPCKTSLQYSFSTQTWPLLGHPHRLQIHPECFWKLGFQVAFQEGNILPLCFPCCTNCLSSFSKPFLPLFSFYLSA